MVILINIDLPWCRFWQFQWCRIDIDLHRSTIVTVEKVSFPYFVSISTTSYRYRFTNMSVLLRHYTFALFTAILCVNIDDIDNIVSIFDSPLPITIVVKKFHNLSLCPLTHRWKKTYQNRFGYLYNYFVLDIVKIRCSNVKILQRLL